MEEKEGIRADISEIMSSLRRLILNYRDEGFESPIERAQGLKILSRAPLDAVSIDEMRILLAGCTRCKLSDTRTHIVFGEGSPSARVMFVGEGPGREEDLEGRPFVGRAGELLTRIIERGMGLKRRDVYIANVVKCRPPGNRDPEPDEISACLPFLEKQIRLIRPDVICTLGRVALRALAGVDGPLKDHRGKIYSWEGIPVVGTYHPAFIVRNPQMERKLKALVWEDIKVVMRKIGMEV